MENISPFVDKILCYQYIGIMNKPGTDIIAGHPDSLRLYEQYSAWYNQYKTRNEYVEKKYNMASDGFLLYSRSGCRRS